MTAWAPKTAAELEAALETETLAGGTHLDFKERLETTASANKALAVDIAAMSVAGGGNRCEHCGAKDRLRTEVRGAARQGGGTPAPDRTHGLSERTQGTTTLGL